MLRLRLPLTRSVLGAIALVFAFAASPAAAVPLVEFYVDGVLYDSWTCGDPEFDCTTDPKIDELLFFQIVTTDWTLNGITGLFDPDPRIDYGATIIDHGDPNTFGFVFLQDIASVLAPGTATHEFSSSTTDGGVDGVPVSPAPPLAGIPQDPPGTNDEIAVFTLSTDAGVNYLNAALDLGPAFVGAANDSDTQGPYGPETGPGPGSGSYNRMRVDVNFTMAGNDDVYSPGGFAEIVVPEPAALGLVGIGIAVLAIAGRRRA